MSSSTWARTYACFSPSMVNESRFGYTRFFNSAGRELAFKRDVVDRARHPGSEGRRPGHLGHPQRRARRTTAASATIPKARTRITTTRCSSSTTSPGFAASTRSGSAAKSAATSTTRSATSSPAARSLFDRMPPASRGATRVHRRVGGDAFADFLLGYSKRSEAAVAIAEAQVPQLELRRLFRRCLEGHSETDHQLSACATN